MTSIMFFIMLNVVIGAINLIKSFFPYFQEIYWAKRCLLIRNDSSLNYVLHLFILLECELNNVGPVFLAVMSSSSSYIDTQSISLLVC